MRNSFVKKHLIYRLKAGKIISVFFGRQINYHPE
jgi:hypothetical protein